MPKLIFIAAGGEPRAVEAANGDSAMRAAVSRNVPGIDAECGGACACATCHVEVDEAWAGRLPPPERLETETLDFVAHRTPTSRLSCQIRVTPDLDGLVLRIPESQG